MQILTKKLLHLATQKGELNASQCTLLDIDVSERKEVASLCLTKELSDARAELLVLLCGVQEEQTQKDVIENYKALQAYRRENAKEEIQNRENLKEKIDLCEKMQEKSLEYTNVSIYCDGGCTPNPGKAGSGVVLYRDDALSEIWYGLYEDMGTNNTAELQALYNSLRLAQEEIQRGKKVEIKCDSKYSIECIKTWAISWEKKGWTKKGGAIKNLEIIKKAYALYNSIKKDLTLSHIKAHAGFEGNELADRMTAHTIQTQERTFKRYTKEINIENILDGKF